MPVALLSELTKFGSNEGGQPPCPDTATATRLIRRYGSSSMADVVLRLWALHNLPDIPELAPWISTSQNGRKAIQAVILRVIACAPVRVTHGGPEFDPGQFVTVLLTHIRPRGSA